METEFTAQITAGMKSRETNKTDTEEGMQAKVKVKVECRCI
jgi:hypothetical protein